MLGIIERNPYYPVEQRLGDSVAPWTFVDKIDVPVFLAGAWQDEQTGGHFPAMLDKFTGTDQEALHADERQPHRVADAPGDRPVVRVPAVLRGRPGAGWVEAARHRTGHLPAGPRHATAARPEHPA